MLFPDDLWRLTLQHSPIGMALAAPDGRVLSANQALSDMLGYPPDELAQRDFRSLTHADDLDTDVDLYRQTMAGEIDSYRLTKRYRHATGRVVWGDLSVALLRDAEGAPVHFICQVLDITAQRQGEQRFRAATETAVRDRQTLEAIFETVSVGLLLIGPDGRYERMNRRHQGTMNLMFPNGHAGQSGQVGEIFELDGRTPMASAQMPSYRATQGEEFDDLTYWVGRDPQRRAAFSVSARQVRGPDGESRGAALAYQEVTDLLRAVRAQDEFVASVSHELRTPLASVLGYLELLAEHDGLPTDVAEQLQVVERNALRLDALLTDLLDVAQAREGALGLERRPVLLSEIAREAVQAALPAATAAELVIELRVEDPDDVVVDVDEQRLRQVLDNLLANAVKYSTVPSTISIDVRRRGDTAEIAVRDAGIGIPPDEVEQVFERFFRGADAVGRQVPGTGLGLTIVRSIVEAHGGSITVDSTPGGGSTFLVALPGAVAGVD